MPDPRQALIEQVKRLQETTKKVARTNEETTETPVEEETPANRR